MSDNNGFWALGSIAAILVTTFVVAGVNSQSYQTYSTSRAWQNKEAQEEAKLSAPIPAPVEIQVAPVKQSCGAGIQPSGTTKLEWSQFSCQPVASNCQCFTKDQYNSTEGCPGSLYCCGNCVKINQSPVVQYQAPTVTQQYQAPTGYNTTYPSTYYPSQVYDGPKPVHVRSYVRRDGTVVREHNRRSRN